MLSKCHFCSGREVLRPHLRKSPGCHAVGLEAVRGMCALKGQVQSPSRVSFCYGGSSGVGRACSKWGTPPLSLSL